MDGSATPDVRELRIFLESLICDLCRLRHASEDGIPPGSTQIHQEVRLSPGVFAEATTTCVDAVVPVAHMAKEVT